MMDKQTNPPNEYNSNGSGYQDDYSEDENEDITPNGLAATSKPLMYPRQGRKEISPTSEYRNRVLCKPVLYFLLSVTVLGALATILLLLLNKHTDPDQSEETVPQKNKVTASMPHEIEELIGCDTVEVEDVWVVGFPKLITESAIRLVDVNQDGVLDIIIGFGSDTDRLTVPRLICDVYFNGIYPCNGGILALDGLTGREIWRHYSLHEVYGLNCNVDIDQDGVLDCLGAGRVATFEALSGKDGKLLWTFQDGEAKKRVSNVYTPQYIDDLDGDHVPDLLVAHGGDPVTTTNPYTIKPYEFSSDRMTRPEVTYIDVYNHLVAESKTRESGQLLLMSGRSGHIIRRIDVVEGKEMYYSPQIYFQADGTRMVLFGTGGETEGGSLWVITLDHLKQGRIDQARAIYTDDKKGVMTPPLLVDLTGDGTLDVVINPFNSTVLAIDGRSYSLLWKHTFSMSESYSTPGGGYFNADDTPDFLVTMNVGPGFPVYEYTQTTILDGNTGQPLFQPVQAGIALEASPLSISMEGRGHDLFLYWISDCIIPPNISTSLLKQINRAPCEIFLDIKLFSKLMAVSSVIKPPGATIYFSEEWKYEEHKDWVDTTEEALEFFRNHPECQLSAAGQGLNQENHSAEASKKANIDSGKSGNKGCSNSAHDVTDSGKAQVNRKNGETSRSSFQYNFLKRKRRHIGAHDNDGIQSLISTGTLAPPTLTKQHPDYAHTMDVVLATYWFYPPKNFQIYPEDQECIDKMIAKETQRFDPNNVKYYGLDHDGYNEIVTTECVEKNERQKGDKKFQQNHDPYKLKMGQMTVYRLRLKCTCSQVTNSTVDRRCAKILPFDQQHWPAYMGRYGDSYWH